MWRGKTKTLSFIIIIKFFQTKYVSNRCCSGFSFVVWNTHTHNRQWHKHKIIFESLNRTRWKTKKSNVMLNMVIYWLIQLSINIVIINISTTPWLISYYSLNMILIAINMKHVFFCLKILILFFSFRIFF